MSAARRQRRITEHRAWTRAAERYFALIGQAPERPVRRPASFGLSARELSAHARELHADGWTVEEITQTLAVTPRGRGA